MSEFEIILLIIGGSFAVSGVIFSIFFTNLIARKVYEGVLVRPEGEKRERKCSAPDDEEQVLMYARGLEWAAAHSACLTEVKIENDGLELFGEYYDLGFKRAVIIIPGRTEALTYSYYFAKPYEKAGFNVLVIDSRATGLSDGKYYGVGGTEYRDILKWGELLHDRFANDTVYLHGICIGSSTAIYTLTSENCPGWFSGMTADGMYKSFFETFRLHMVERKKPIFPVCYQVMLHLKKHTGTKGLTYGPYKAVLKMQRPILFLYTKLDRYSLPEEGIKMFNNCVSPVKELRWFDKGGHSHIRINDEDGYDRAILEFTSKL